MHKTINAFESFQGLRESIIDSLESQMRCCEAMYVFLLLNSYGAVNLGGCCEYTTHALEFQAVAVEQFYVFVILKYLWRCNVPEAAAKLD